MSRKSFGIAAGAVTAMALALPGVGAANDGDGRVIRTGDCSGASEWKLKAKPDDGRLQTEFEVDRNRNGVSWRVVLRRNGDVVFRGTRTTQPPSGSFEVNRRLRDGAGTDRITAVARRDGEVCRASLTI